ncbi:MAG: hypothetical protein J6T23_01655 [Elusimicrobia bacterium]|nr:hypothetical protein [Elusimicrobiota bacterium]
MNKNFIKLLSFCLLGVVCFALFTSCERYPVRALLGIHDPIDSWPNPWYIYDDEINTKGSLEPYVFDHNPDGSVNEYCDSWDNVFLSFAWLDNVKVGRKCIKFIWRGNSLDTSVPKKTFFSFGLQAREQLGGVVDLTNSGYTKMKFWIRGNLSSNCKFEIGIPDTLVTKEFTSDKITSDWQEYEIAMNGAGEITFDLSMGMSLTSGDVTNGGEIYLDDIRFVKEEN